MLTKAQIEEVVAFDAKRRGMGDFDGRRFGTVTGECSCSIKESWEPYDGKSVNESLGHVTRKTLAYNLIIPTGRKSTDWKRRDVVVSHVAVRLDRAYKPVVKEVARINPATGSIELIDIDYHGIGGWIVEWDDSDWRSKHEGEKIVRAQHVWNGWCKDCRGWKFGTGTAFPWHETVNPDALRDTKYRYCQYDPSLQRGIGLVDWLSLYNRDPRVELLAKAGLYTLICPAGLTALRNRAFLDWCRRRMDRRGFRRIGVREMQFMFRHGWSAERTRRFFMWRDRQQTEWHHNDRRNVKIDYMRVYRMLPKWGVDGGEYARYLYYAQKAGLDMKCEGVLYPPVRDGRTSFMERMEAIEDELAKRERRRKRMEDAKLKRLMEGRISEIEEFQRSIDRTKSLDLGAGVKVVLAKSQDELLEEGARMNNCVGCGTYGRGIVVGDTLILMFRKNGRPYCDAEISRSGRTWRVRQCYAAGNSKAPDGIITAAEKIAKILCAKFRKMKKDNGKAA